MFTHRPCLRVLLFPLLAALVAGCQHESRVIGVLPVNPILAAHGTTPPAPDRPKSAVRSGVAAAAADPQPVLLSAHADGQAAWTPAGSFERPWRWIIIHHSSTDVGSAEIFDAAHRAKGWDELGYHFVIDNGRGGGNGQVEVGSRWTKQKWGAHTGGTPNNDYNNFGIGICLVGDFNSHLPSQAQLEGLKKLVAFLMDRYHLEPSCIIGHRDAPNANTECPGDALYRYVYNDLRPAMSARGR